LFKNTSVQDQHVMQLFAQLHTVRHNYSPNPDLRPFELKIGTSATPA